MKYATIWKPTMFEDEMADFANSVLPKDVKFSYQRQTMDKSNMRLLCFLTTGERDTMCCKSFEVQSAQDWATIRQFTYTALSQLYGKLEEAQEKHGLQTGTMKGKYVCQL